MSTKCRIIVELYFSCPLFLMYVVFVVFMSGCFNFSKPVLRAPVPPTAISIFQKQGFRASKPSAAIFIFKKGALRLKNIYDGLNVFQKPALHASKPSTVHEKGEYPKIIFQTFNVKSLLVPEHSKIIRINGISYHF